MNSMKSFVVTMVMWTSFTVREALERTITNAYLGSHRDAILYWVGSILMAGIFFVALPHIWKDGQSQPTSNTANSTKNSFLLWIPSLGFIGIALVNIQPLIHVLSTPQIPPSLKSLFLAVTLINLIFTFAWAAGNFRQWKSAQKK